MNARHRQLPDDPAPDIRIVAGDPTPAEVAAVTAVITSLAQDLSDEAREDAIPAQSAWQRSQRPIRQPFRPGEGTWRGGF